MGCASAARTSIVYKAVKPYETGAWVYFKAVKYTLYSNFKPPPGNKFFIVRVTPLGYQRFRWLVIYYPTRLVLKPVPNL